MRGAVPVCRLLRALDQGRGALPRARRQVGGFAEPELRQHRELVAHALRDHVHRGLGRCHVRRVGLDGVLLAAQAGREQLDGTLLCRVHLVQLHVFAQLERRRDRRQVHGLEATRPERHADGGADQVARVAEGAVHEVGVLQPVQLALVAPRAALRVPLDLHQAVREHDHGRDRGQRLLHDDEGLPRPDRVLDVDVRGGRPGVFPDLLAGVRAEVLRPPGELLEGPVEPLRLLVRRRVGVRRAPRAHPLAQLDLADHVDHQDLQDRPPLPVLRGHEQDLHGAGHVDPQARQRPWHPIAPAGPF
mmetsp:Transcript_34373/g.103769  ORF Transcript_34373/g.103769 Transcript_34373/m.103769 type:complete len:303 (-) Transcript_34373:1187-2095(-)